jgi:hypothetical protein
VSDFIEPIKDAETPNEMRAEFERLRNYDPLVRSVFDMARYSGMSGEDKYVVLAYHAIRQFKHMQKLHLNNVMTTVGPNFFIKDKP